MGDTRDAASIRRIGESTGQRVFKTNINDGLANAYTLFNLKPSTAYKVQVALVFKEFKDRLSNYWAELKIPNSNELKPIKSVDVFFNTAQLDVDDFIEQELEEARRTRRNKSNKIAFSQSEKVLYEFAEFGETKEVFTMYSN